MGVDSMDKGKLDEDNTEKVPRWSSYRNALAGWGFFSTLCVYLLRINFSVAIVCMTYDEEDNGTSGAGNNSIVLSDPVNYGAAMYREEEDVVCSVNNSTAEQETGEFDWDRELRGFLSSSFFWGYVITQFPGGWLAQKIGGKRMITVGMSISILMSFLSPPAARLSPYALAAARFINGLGQGVFYPAFYVLIGYWFPLSERAFLMALFSTGSTLGSVLSFALSGVLCAQVGWTWIFYTYSLLSVVWIICWIVFVHDTPALHPRISTAERNFIQASLGHVDNKKMPPVPWGSLFRDPSVWALAVTDFCTGWALYAGLTQLPQYMEDVLQFDIAQNGLYSALPTLVKFFMDFVFALLGDFILNLHVMRVITLRRIMSSIAFLIPMMAVIAVGYLDCNTAGLAILFLIIQEGFTSAQRAGHTVSRVDIAPQFSGATLGICNTSGNVAGIIAPIVIGVITVDGTRAQWQKCFFMSALMYLVAWLTYMIFGRSDVRKWARTDAGISNPAAEVIVKDCGDVPEKTSDFTTLKATSLSDDIIITHM